MKFLVLTSPKAQFVLPPDAIPSVLTQQREWIDEQLSAGVIEVIYGFPYGGAVAIVEAKSGDALSSLLTSSPAYPLIDWEIRPLAKIDVALRNAAEMFERVSEHLPAYR